MNPRKTFNKFRSSVEIRQEHQGSRGPNPSEPTQRGGAGLLVFFFGACSGLKSCLVSIFLVTNFELLIYIIYLALFFWGWVGWGGVDDEIR